MDKKFQPGDQVKHKYRDQIMIVVNYVPRLNGSWESGPLVVLDDNTRVRCSWDKNGKKVTDMFLEKDLILIKKTAR